MSRADRQTYNSKTPILYSDFTTNFDRNPVTGLLARVTNEESVKQAIKNLILTGLTERPYQPHVGSKIATLLFDPMDDVTENLIKDSIRFTINNNEPRVHLIDVTVQADQNRNEYKVSIVFSLINIPSNQIAFSLALTRVR